jgi:hypothetical protein
VLICQQKLLQTEKEHRKTEDERVHHYSPVRLEILANALSVSVGTLILLIPVFLLFLLSMNRIMMAVTASSFVVVFSVVVSTVTGAKVHEVRIIGLLESFVSLAPKTYQNRQC